VLEKVFEVAEYGKWFAILNSNCADSDD